VITCAEVEERRAVALAEAKLEREFRQWQRRAGLRPTAQARARLRQWREEAFWLGQMVSDWILEDW
jgi:hypothetical protein